MKKLLFTVSNDLNNDQRMQRICSTLSEEGFDVTLVGRKRNSSKPLLHQPYKQKRLSLMFDKGKLFYIELQVRLFLYLIFQKFDVVCGIDLDTILPCYFSAKLRSKHCLYDAHELFSEVPEVARRPFVRSIWLRVESFICTRKTIVKYTVSQSVAEEFKIRYDSSFSVIRNFPLSKNTQESRKEKIIVYRGAVNEGRGLEALIRAMPEINASLIIAGDGDITEQLKLLAGQCAVSGKITFTGYLNPDELDEISKKAYIGVNLLEQHSKNYYYSLANKFFDYVQLHIPQVCMNFPEYRRMNEQHEVAILIDSTDSKILTHSINKLLEDESLYMNLCSNCKVASQEWTWDIEKKNLVDIYKKL